MIRHKALGIGTHNACALFQVNKGRKIVLGKEVAGRLEANNALTFLLIKSRKQQGFTLIELSIVLVIIGLIVGRIMVGANLIHAAKLRSQIKQMQDLETAINTFQIKYNCLPGDCPNAVQFFNDPLVVNGNGDRIILDSASGYNSSNCLTANYGQGEGAEEVAQLFYIFMMRLESLL